MREKARRKLKGESNDVRKTYERKRKKEQKHREREVWRKGRRKARTWATGRLRKRFQCRCSK